MIDICNRMYEDSSITNKGKAWSDQAHNPKFYGVAFTNVVKWHKPEEHHRLLKAAARKHASSLLRIDKESRKKGKYAAMERDLFVLFKRRRARNRKSSGRWLTHMARHLLRQSNPTAALTFKGGKTWRKRYRARFGISVRKKTNCKNTTWEETKPVLQRYFRALRRRVTLSAEELAAYAVAPAANEREPSWVDVAAQQGVVTKEMLQAAAVGKTFALYDTSSEESRRILLVRARSVRHE